MRYTLPEYVIEEVAEMFRVGAETEFDTEFDVDGDGEGEKVDCMDTETKVRDGEGEPETLKLGSLETVLPDDENVEDRSFDTVSRDSVGVKVKEEALRLSVADVSGDFVDVGESLAVPTGDADLLSVGVLLNEGDADADADTLLLTVDERTQLSDSEEVREDVADAELDMSLDGLSTVCENETERLAVADSKMDADALEEKESDTTFVGDGDADPLKTSDHDQLKLSECSAVGVEEFVADSDGTDGDALKEVEKEDEDVLLSDSESVGLIHNVTVSLTDMDMDSVNVVVVVRVTGGVMRGRVRDSVSDSV